MKPFRTTTSTARRALTAGVSAGLLAVSAGLTPVAAYASAGASGTFVLSTINPATKCGADDIVGRDDITLSALNTSATTGSVTTNFHLSVAGTTTNLLSPSGPVTTSAGVAAIYDVSRNILEAASSGDFTEFTWSVTSAVGSQAPVTSKTCTFTMDYSTPGVPVITGTAAPTVGVDCVQTGSGPSTVPMGSECSFTVTPTTTGGDLVPAGYGYLLDQGDSGTVSAAKPGKDDTFDPTTGVATLTLPLVDQFSVLTIWALSPGGNIGPSATLNFFGAYPATVTNDGDMNGDGHPDLILTGGVGDVPSGLWYARGKANGSVATNTVDIDPSGFFFGDSASDWDGVQAVSGPFCGDNVQDLLAYNPADGGGAVLCSDNSTDARTAFLQPGENTGFEIPWYTFNDGTDNATQVVYAGNTAFTNGGAGTDAGIDMLATIGDQLVLFTAFSPTAYFYDPGYSSDDFTSTPSPDGTYDWDSWTLASTQINGATDLYLWNPTTGALDLWTGLSAGTGDPSATDGPFPNALTLSAANKYVLADGVTTHWNQGANLDLRSGDLNGAPVLWTVDTSSLVAQTFLPDSTDTGLRTVATETLVPNTKS